MQPDTEVVTEIDARGHAAKDKVRPDIDEQKRLEVLRLLREDVARLEQKLDTGAEALARETNKLHAALNEKDAMQRQLANVSEAAGKWWAMEGMINAFMPRRSPQFTRKDDPTSHP